jgi:hypothetical protein
MVLFLLLRRFLLRLRLRLLQLLWVDLVLVLLAVMAIGLVGGRGVVDRVVASVGWMTTVDLGTICWVVIMLVMVLEVYMVVEVDMDARLGHCSAATRDGQGHISRPSDSSVRLSPSELVGRPRALMVKF